MTAENFCYWLQGLLELNGVTELSVGQVAIINDHLKLVFNKATPVRLVEKTLSGATISPPENWNYPQCSTGPTGVSGDDYDPLCHLRYPPVVASC